MFVECTRVNTLFQEELSSLVKQAQQGGINITRDEVETNIRSRKNVEDEAVSYSWVHLNDFRVFELHGRCFPWTDPHNLRDAIENIP